MSLCRPINLTMAQSFIRRVPLFQGLNDDEIAALHDVIQIRQYNKKERIFQEGEQSNTLFVVNQGMVKIYKLSDNGKEQILRILFPGDFFGQFSLFLEKEHYANAEALEPTKVCLIHRQDLKAIIQRNPEMAYKFLATFSERLHQADEWTGTISLLEVERRLAKTLLLFYEKKTSQNQVLQLPIEKKDFASLIGTTAETLSRKLAHLQSLNLISLEGRKAIRIIDPKGLAKIAGSF